MKPYNTQTHLKLFLNIQVQRMGKEFKTFLIQLRIEWSNFSYKIRIRKGNHYLKKIKTVAKRVHAADTNKLSIFNISY
jgi:hypothetical protein